MSLGEKKKELVERMKERKKKEEKKMVGISSSLKVEGEFYAKLNIRLGQKI